MSHHHNQLSARQRKALGWIVQIAVENFNSERDILQYREAEDIEGDLESLIPLLNRNDRHAASILLALGGDEPVAPAPELRIAA